MTYRGTRIRVAANEFAIPRMDPDKQRPIHSLEEARDWERVFIGEIKAGRDPRRPRPVQKSSDAVPKDIADFLDAYVERCVRPAALKSMNSIGSRIAVIKEHLGDLPLEALEEPGEINRFKSQSAYAKRVELATIHRTLETLRAATRRHDNAARIHDETRADYVWNTVVWAKSESGRHGKRSERNDTPVHDAGGFGQFHKKAPAHLATGASQVKS